MPQKNNEDPSEQAPAIGLSAVSGELTEAEIGGFLSFLFHHVAYRPDVLLLLETAAAVRFLQTLARKGVPAELTGRQRGRADDTRSDDSEETLEGKRLLPAPGSSDLGGLVPVWGLPRLRQAESEGILAEAFEDLSRLPGRQAGLGGNRGAGDSRRCRTTFSAAPPDVADDERAGPGESSSRR